jgi:hypothetical protein
LHNFELCAIFNFGLLIFEIQKNFFSKSFRRRTMTKRVRLTANILGVKTAEEFEAMMDRFAAVNGVEVRWQDETCVLPEKNAKYLLRERGKIALVSDTVAMDLAAGVVEQQAVFAAIVTGHCRVSDGLENSLRRQ